MEIWFITLKILNDHSKLIIEGRSTILTQKRVDFDNLPYGLSMRSPREVEASSACRPYLQSSSYVEISPQVWRLAVDVRETHRMCFRRLIKLWNIFIPIINMLPQPPVLMLMPMK